MKHKHHLNPKYMGGTDAPDNLIEVTVKQHAMFHFCNYQLWGNEYDMLAWKALSGQISFDDATYQAMKIGSDKARAVQQERLKDPEYRKRWSDTRKELWKKEEYRATILASLKKSQPKASALGNSPEANEKRKESFKKIDHQQGEKNSMYGMMWITDGTREGSRRIPKGDPIPDGFRRGRVNPKNYIK